MCDLLDIFLGVPRRCIYLKDLRQLFDMDFANFLGLLAIFLGLCRAEIFTSLAEMEYLVETERTMISSLKNYIQLEEERLQTMKSFVSRLDNVMDIINQTDPGKYLANPVNSYLMLKRFNVDWRNLETLLTEDLAEDLTATFNQFKPYFPTREDFEGAMTALFRLQDTYKLQTDTFAKGEIPGAAQLNSPGLTPREAFDIARFAYTEKDWSHAQQWMQVALSRIGNETEIEGVTKSDVLDHLAYSTFKNGDIKTAFALTQELAILLPEKRIYDNLQFYKDTLRTLEPSRGKGDPGDYEKTEEFLEVEQPPVKDARAEWKSSWEFNNYEKMCRGEARELSRAEQRKLKCWYKKNNPMLLLKPAKIERVWVHPEVFMLRGMLSENMIDKIKNAASPMLRRATIQDPITGVLRHADYRVSKSAWLGREKYGFVEQLIRQAQAITNMNMSAAEQLQVANYGIAGHYEPHFDHAREDEDKFSDLGIGNRIATILFYLSNVEAGGATAFVTASTALFPSKGDAAFWFNLKKNGIGNPITRHAACPVLAGTKWVSNWWIHERGQEFRRKCSLNPNA